MMLAKETIMKRLTCALILLLGIGYTNAQVAQWLIPPEYNNIVLPNNANIVIAEQGDTKFIWSMEGKCLEKLTDHLYPYSDGYAVSVSPNKARITAFYDTEGKKKDVSKHNVMPGWNHALFHDGFLLVNDGEFFYYLDDKGVIDSTPYHYAYPFYNGYALCINYGNLSKLKNPLYQLLDTNLKPVSMIWQGKKFKQEEIEFISSINDAGIGIVEAKGKVFFFHAESGKLSPVMSSPTDQNIKNHARLDGSLEEGLTSFGDTVQQLTARSGRHGSVTITFDSMYKPVTINYSGEVHTFDKKKNAVKEQEKMLYSMADDNNKIGLYWDGIEMLPPQFDEVPLCFGNKAIVAMNGKYGMLQINRNNRFRIRLNKDEPIGFRHHRFDTNIRIDMPPYISPATVSIELAEDTKCHIDNIPYETKETNYGNYALYRCELFMPDSLTDEAIDITYSTHIVYNQLRSPAIDTKCTAWHMKYFNVDIDDSNYSITNGTLSFIFNVTPDRQPGESIYPHEASIIADSLIAEITERVSETRYKCKVYNLHEGINTFTIQILEKGCPPADFTFEVNYISRPMRGEKKVTMKKKKKETTPQLRI